VADRENHRVQVFDGNGRYETQWPRQCIGNSFAQMEAVLLLATIAQRFRLSLVPGQRITPTPYITLRPEPGIRMLLARR